MLWFNLKSINNLKNIELLFQFTRFVINKDELIFYNYIDIILM